jgi:hypothetical protein
LEIAAEASKRKIMNGCSTMRAICRI